MYTEYVRVASKLRGRQRGCLPSTTVDDAFRGPPNFACLCINHSQTRRTICLPAQFNRAVYLNIHISYIANDAQTRTQKLSSSFERAGGSPAGATKAKDNGSDAGQIGDCDPTVNGQRSWLCGCVGIANHIIRRMRLSAKLERLMDMPAVCAVFKITLMHCIACEANSVVCLLLV